MVIGSCLINSGKWVRFPSPVNLKDMNTREKSPPLLPECNEGKSHWKKWEKYIEEQSQTKKFSWIGPWFAEYLNIPYKEAVDLLQEHFWSKGMPMKEIAVVEKCFNDLVDNVLKQRRFKEDFNRLLHEE